MKPTLEIFPEPSNRSGYHLASAAGSGFDNSGELIATTTGNTLPEAEPDRMDYF